jgi:hypothetical protein
VQVKRGRAHLTIKFDDGEVIETQGMVTAKRRATQSPVEFDDGTKKLYDVIIDDIGVVVKDDAHARMGRWPA